VLSPRHVYLRSWSSWTSLHEINSQLSFWSSYPIYLALSKWLQHASRVSCTCRSVSFSGPSERAVSFRFQTGTAEGRRSLWNETVYRTLKQTETVLKASFFRFSRYCGIVWNNQLSKWVTKYVLYMQVSTDRTTKWNSLCARNIRPTGSVKLTFGWMNMWGPFHRW